MTSKKWVTSFKESIEEHALEYSVVRNGSHEQKSLGYGDGINKFILFDRYNLFESKQWKEKAKTICQHFADYLNSIKY